MRPELISTYQRSKTFEYVSEKMKPFNEQLLKSRTDAPGLPDSEEYKLFVLKREQDEGVLKIKEVEKLMQESPKLKFNVNVFRSGVEFVQSDSEEIK